MLALLYLEKLKILGPGKQEYFISGYQSQMETYLNMILLRTAKVKDGIREAQRQHEETNRFCRW